MTPERLAQIRRYCAPSCDDEYLSMPDKWLRELLAHVDDLSRQLDDARDIAVRSGYFQNWTGADYEAHAGPEPVQGITEQESDSFMDAIGGEVPDGCRSCFTCLPSERGQRMFLCSLCGNKRCPHATDCALDCTQSNEPGQVGSRYWVPLHMPGFAPIPGVRLEFGITPPDRPSAYDMPVGSVVVVGHDYDGEPQTYTRCHADDNGGWARWSTDPGDLTKPATIQSGWIEGLFTDELVTEWRLPNDDTEAHIARLEEQAAGIRLAES